MAGRSFANWQDLGAETLGTSPVHGPPPHIRDALEADRLAWRRVPGEQYPDGYLGTIQSRRGDRVLESVNRSNSRSYVRGIHRETRLNVTDYLWPAEFNLMSGIVNQAMTGERFTPPGLGQEPVLLTNDGKPGPRDAMRGIPGAVGTPVLPDPDRVNVHRGHLPPWV